MQKFEYHHASANNGESLFVIYILNVVLYVACYFLLHSLFAHQYLFHVNFIFFSIIFGLVPFRLLIGNLCHFAYSFIIYYIKLIVLREIVVILSQVFFVFLNSSIENTDHYVQQWTVKICSPYPEFVLTEVLSIEKSYNFSPSHPPLIVQSKLCSFLHIMIEIWGNDFWYPVYRGPFVWRLTKMAQNSPLLLRFTIVF